MHQGFVGTVELKEARRSQIRAFLNYCKQYKGTGK
jgi:hypothetical protein